MTKINRESQRRAGRKYYNKNKDKPEFKAAQKKYAPQKVKNKKYRYNNDIEFKKKIVKDKREWGRLRRFEAMELLGGKCVRCGFSDWRALQFDHIDGGGTRDRKGKDNWVILKRIKSGKFRYQLLCANCNWLKRYENDECYRKYPLELE